MAPDADEAVCVFGDKEPELMSELFLCFGCYTGDVCLAEVNERRNEAKAHAEADDANPIPAPPAPAASKK
jgi:hypothetical protein